MNENDSNAINNEMDDSCKPMPPVKELFLWNPFKNRCFSAVSVQFQCGFSAVRVRRDRR